MRARGRHGGDRTVGLPVPILILAIDRILLFLVVGTYRHLREDVHALAKQHPDGIAILRVERFTKIVIDAGIPRSGIDVIR
ncbi:hypothetical protein [Luteibacter sp. W1I16]|uniref:hypothetical protein n=1 Tax=Luteibacter sp. W1I16 TaxID=3373922 RepID=UPI003D228244